MQCEMKFAKRDKAGNLYPRCTNEATVILKDKKENLNHFCDSCATRMQGIAAYEFTVMRVN